MDDRTFDNAVRALGGAVTRRTGFAALAGAILGGVAASAGAAARRRDRGHDRTNPEGICGNGAISRCSKNADCCSGYCHTNGRCRCAPPGTACSAATICCQGSTCYKKTCTRNRDIPVPCSAATCPNGCCSAKGACVPHSRQGPSSCGTGGAACAACTGSDACVSGICAPACSAASCPSGCCDGGTCVAQGSQTDGQCGTSGGACTACAAGYQCINGACEETCAIWCTTGCCLDATNCVYYAGQNSAVCGTGGATCAACSVNQTCSSGVCA